MTQHFLLSAAARSFSPATVARLSDRRAEHVFARLQWPGTDGKPVCPGLRLRNLLRLSSLAGDNPMAPQGVPRGLPDHVGDVVRLEHHAGELLAYLERNQGALVHCAAQPRSGETISTTFVESSVNVGCESQPSRCNTVIRARTRPAVDARICKSKPPLNWAKMRGPVPDRDPAV
jgi:hypothetical protein